MLNRSATANDSTENKNVIASTRAGIPIHRGPLELAWSMLLGYIIEETVATASPSKMPICNTLQYCHVSNCLRNHPQPRGNRANQPRFTSPQWHLLRPLGRNYYRRQRSRPHDCSGASASGLGPKPQGLLLRTAHRNPR